MQNSNFEVILFLATTISEPGMPKTRVFQTWDPKDLKEKCPRDLQIWHNFQLWQFADFAEVMQNLCKIYIIANFSSFAQFPHFCALAEFSRLGGPDH